ncbi:Uncharacterised protein [Mycobacterium tuberculosis]|nr:Uncharacterised protein [Mycobacterium tuberculosis]
MLAAASAVSGTFRRKPRTAIAVSPGRASARIGGTSSNSPIVVVTRPGTSTKTEATVTSAPSLSALRGSAKPDRNHRSRRPSCQPPSGASRPNPRTNVASNTSKVQPNPIVAASAKTTASSTTA